MINNILKEMGEIGVEIGGDGEMKVYNESGGGKIEEEFKVERI